MTDVPKITSAKHIKDKAARLRRSLAQEFFVAAGHRFTDREDLAIACYSAGFKKARSMNDTAVDRAYQDGIRRGRELADLERKRNGIRPDESVSALLRGSDQTRDAAPAPDVRVFTMSGLRR